MRRRSAVGDEITAAETAPSDVLAALAAAEAEARARVMRAPSAAKASLATGREECRPMAPLLKHPPETVSRRWLIGPGNVKKPALTSAANPPSSIPASVKRGVTLRQSIES